MLKYRIELKKTYWLLIFQLVTYLLLVFAILSVQSELIDFQIWLQLLAIVITTHFIFKEIKLSFYQRPISVVFSQQGEWLEVRQDQQISWSLTGKSRISAFLLFIHLVSPLNPSRSKWCIVFKEQVNEEDFRRLCRVIIFQQQTADKS